MKDKKRLLIIGGSDAGISAGLRAHEIDPQLAVEIIVADAYPNYSICGLPFYLSGEVPDWRSLAHRTLDGLLDAGIKLKLNHLATAINTGKKTVKIADGGGIATELSYDRLIIGTGSRPVRPQITGIDLPGVYLLHTMEDSFRIYEALSSKNARSVIIVGSGYIGVEMADALSHRGMNVTLIGRSPAVLPTVEKGFGKLIETELKKHAVEIANGVEVNAIEAGEGGLIVTGSPGFQAKADIVVLAAGVRPATSIAADAGISLNAQGAIKVTREMLTDAEDVYAAGDCAETWHRVTKTNTYLPLGTTAHKQGRVAGSNAAGSSCRFNGTLGTQVVKVFDLAVARTGLLEQEARKSGFNAFTIESKVWDHKAYYPGANELYIRVTGDRVTGRLLGAQMIGHWQSGAVAKRIDIFAAALYHEMTIEELNDLDLSYTPPMGSPWDPVQLSAQAWLAQK